MDSMKILDIKDREDGPRFIKEFTLETADNAKECEIKFLIGVRKLYFAADLNAKNEVLCLNTPQKEATTKIGEMLRKAIESL